MTIINFSHISAEQWNAFVDAHPKGTLFHRTEWKEIIERSFPYKSFYFGVEDKGEIAGLLPLFHVKGPLAGNQLISTPFAVYGGLLAKNKNAEAALLEEAQNRADKLDARYVEFRHTAPVMHDALLTKDSLYATFIKTMPECVSDIYEQLPKEARRMVRKGRNNGLVIKFDTESLDAFYNIYAVSVQKFGTPVFSKKLFKNCLGVLKENANFLLVLKDDSVIAAVLSFYYKDTVLPYYSGMTPEAKTLAPHNLMYLSLMEHARERGCTIYDFGRSKMGTGAAKFKQNMGFEATPLPYQYYLRNGVKLPNKNQTNPKYDIALNVWKRLPLGMTKLIGPHVVKLFP